jgi:hypothetical protein
MKELNFQEYLVELAEEAKIKLMPWEAFEYQPPSTCAWLQCDAHLWLDVTYRRKPRTVTRTVTWPEPLRDVKHGEECWTFDLGGVCPREFCNGGAVSRDLLKGGRLWATRDEAVAARNAILGVGDE